MSSVSSAVAISQRESGVHASEPGRAVPFPGQRDDRAGLEVAQLHHLPVGLVPGPRHRDIGEVLPIGRGSRQRVGGFVRRGQVDGGAARKIAPPDIEIGRARLGLVAFAGDEVEALAIGRPGDILVAAKGLAGSVADQRVGASGAVRRNPAAHGLAVREIEGEHPADGAGRLPRIPVADKAAVGGVEPAGARPGQMRLGVAIGAAEAGAVARDIRPHRDPVAARGDREAVHAGGQVGHLRLAAGRAIRADLRAPHLAGRVPPFGAAPSARK